MELCPRRQKKGQSKLFIQLFERKKPQECNIKVIQPGHLKEKKTDIGDEERNERYKRYADPEKNCGVFI